MSLVDIWQNIVPFLPAIGGAIGQLVRQVAAWGTRKIDPEKEAYWNWWETAGKAFVSVIGGGLAGTVLTMETGNPVIGFVSAIFAGYGTIDGYERGLKFLQTFKKKE